MNPLGLRRLRFPFFDQLVKEQPDDDNPRRALEGWPLAQRYPHRLGPVENRAFSERVLPVVGGEAVCAPRQAAINIIASSLSTLAFKKLHIKIRFTPDH